MSYNKKVFFGREKEPQAKLYDIIYRLREKLNLFIMKNDFSSFNYEPDLKHYKIEAKIDKVIGYLNSVVVHFGKRGYSTRGKKIRSLIRTKIKQGYKHEDFQDVINVKVTWLTNPDMHKYFRPDTLFGNKFESYLNELNQPIKPNDDDKYNEAYNDSDNDFK
jgi:uncharacterized phage protein (TIGR02220 family)